jgi:hypothetical protein
MLTERGIATIALAGTAKDVDIMNLYAHLIQAYFGSCCPLEFCLVKIKDLAFEKYVTAFEYSVGA